MRLIDADALKDIFSLNSNIHISKRLTVLGVIAKAPTIEAEPVRRGRWIREPNCWYRCSVCGDHYPSITGNMKYNYCPNCGAKMEEVSIGRV